MRLTSVNLRDVRAPLRDKVENENELGFTSQKSLQYVDIEIERDENNSYGEHVKQCFDKVEFMINSTLD